MSQHLISIFGSVILVSLLSLVGVVTLGMREELLKKAVFALVSFAAGAMFGGAFLHLIPKTAAEFGLTTLTGLYILSGIVLFFIVEKYIHWHHHHFMEDDCPECVEPWTYMVLLGDGVHNFIDGLIIAAAYLTSFGLGAVTTVAVMLHEIPQEIGDFGVLVHGGFSVQRALLYNFLSAAAAVLGAAVVLLFAAGTGARQVLIPFAAGGFIYIAGTDLLPEFKEETGIQKSTVQVGTFVLGIAAMYGLKVVVQTYL